MFPSTIHFQYHINLYKLEGNSTKKIFSIPKFDRCRFLDNSGKAHPIMKVVLALFRTFFSQSMKCPFTGTYVIKDFSLDHQSLFILPKGIIRYSILGTTDVDDCFGFISLLFEID